LQRFEPTAIVEILTLRRLNVSFHWHNEPDDAQNKEYSMKLLMTSCFSMAIAACLLVAPAVIGQDEGEIAIDQLPKSVVEAIMARFPGAKLTEAGKDEDDGKAIYEVELEHKDDSYYVTVTPEGKLTTVNRYIDVEDLPKPVAESLKKKYPHGSLEEADEALADGKTTYEVIVVTAVKVTVDPKGKILKEDFIPVEEMDVDEDE
jgi:uncharacterized membrane protein YkoI